MKSRISSIFFLAALFALTLLGVYSLSGCAGLDPTVKSDTAKIASDQATLQQLQAQLAALTKQLGATTQPSDQSAITSKISDLTTQIGAMRTQIAAETAQKATDTATANAAQVQSGATVASNLVSTIPGPWSFLAALAIMAVGNGVSAYIGGKGKDAIATAAVTSAASTAQAHAASTQTMSDNHSAAIQSLLSLFNQYLPALIKAVPANLQAGASALVSAVESAIPAAAVTTTTTTTAVDPNAKPAS